MTVDELKSEAKKKGYYLNKIKESLIDIYPCPICGNTRQGRTKGKIFWEGHMSPPGLWDIECQKCRYHIWAVILTKDSFYESVWVYDNKESINIKIPYTKASFSSERKRENFIREMWNYSCLKRREE